ncbi:MAG: hypothetical protein EBQ85_07180 [Proteobacteria bacterium]|nr:hypothetical protein [Pseudomonadota bacterium]
MKSRFLFVVLLVLSSSSYAAFEVLVQNRDSVVLKMTTPKPRLKSVSIQGRPYLRIESDELSNQMPSGFPEIPTQSDLIWIPEGKRPVVKVNVKSYKEISLEDDLAFEEWLPNHCGQSKKVKRNKLAYKKNYGFIAAEIIEEGFAVSDRLARIRVWPFRYEPLKRKLAWAPDIEVTVSFEIDREKTLPVVTDKKNSLAFYLVLNNKGLALPKADNGGGIDLVIAHTSHRAALVRLIDFKKSLGREVREYYVEGKTNQQIKDIILKEYQGAQAPSSTLLVGNIDQLPSWRGSSDNRWTDFHYTTLDSDNLPDISLGRVPAHTESEVNAFTDKVISREKDVNKVEEILLTAGQDESLGCPANVTKVGNKLKTGASFAKIIKKYRTEVSTEDVISAYNDNPNIIVYDGHGNRQGMTEVPLLISSLSKLTNSSYPLLLDIACLNANWGSSASSRNFAESILLSGQRGVAGIMASGGSGYGHDFFQTIGELMGKAQSITKADPKMNQIGQVILAAKIKHGTQDRTYWNYYGDPISRIWEPTVY